MEEDRIENDGPAATVVQPSIREQNPQEAGMGRVIEPENALPEVTLQELPESLRAACARAGWTKLLPVQERAIPYVLAGRNVMVQSQTGSGKTGAFILLDANTGAVLDGDLDPFMEAALAHRVKGGGGAVEDID